jgi:5-methylcytosine-specific restriction protein B
MWRFRSSMKIGDIVVVSNGNREFRAVGVITGDYQFVPSEGWNHRRTVDWLLVLDEPLPVDTIYGKPFSMQSCYLLRDDEVKREALARLLRTDSRGAGYPDQFVLIIDEINRANISKVFGELITLLEPDKRLGQPNALTLKLPYSGETFGVPSNLHIVGTMNTADRSIALLDTALRRRFEFRELMPRPDLLGVVDGIDLEILLTKVNDRIEYLFDREHQIGHAYFIGCASKADIDAIMRYKVIPLLAEYFYDDWSKVAAVLGDAEGDRDGLQGGFLDRATLDPPGGLAAGEDNGPRHRWTVRAPDQFRYDNLQ